MKTLYLECNMGAAGDMLMGALSELVDQNAFVEKMNHIGLEGVSFRAVPSVKCGIHGTHMEIKVHGEEEKSEDVSDHDAVFFLQIDPLKEEEKEHVLHHIREIRGLHDAKLEKNILNYSFDHDHGDEAENQIREILADHMPDAVVTSLGHRHYDHDGSLPAMHMSDIHDLIESLDVSDWVKKNAEEVYQLIAEAESHVHQMKVVAVHFHEVGTLDAVADVVGNCVLLEMIGADRIIASPVATGSGMVHCAHGILPVPAPATAYLLQGIPTYSGNVKGELCTPTGAALLKHFATEFEERPLMNVKQIGYGMGNKDFEEANCVRAFLGDQGDDGSITELVCNLDDISGEEIGHAVDVLFAAGALDVYTTPVQMKKNRPGIVFTCMCRSSDTEKMLKLMFHHLSTLGIREYRCLRHGLHRSMHREETSLGVVRVKRSEGYGTVKEKIEYDDAAAIAEKNGMSVAEVREQVKKEIGSK